MARVTTGKPAGDYSIRSVERVCDILELLSNSPDGESLSALAAVTGLPKSSVFRYLATLEGRGFVERDEAGNRFRLGVAISRLRAEEAERLLERARPVLDDLRDDLGETVNMGRLDGNRVVYVAIAESRQAVRMAVSPGDTEMLHCTALGKVLAAQLPDERVREILRQEGLPRRTDRTLTSAKAFLAELADVRSLGYAIDDEENEPGGVCVAVAIPSRAGYALSLSAPVNRMSIDQARALAGRLSEVAEALVPEPRAVD